MAEMIAFVAHYYGMSAENAAEIIAELRDKRSLERLTSPLPPLAVQEAAQ